MANDADDLLNHLSLQLILDFVHFDIEGGDGLGAHEELDGGFRGN